MPAESALSPCKDRISEPCGARGLVPPSNPGLMRFALVAAIFLLAAPGTAAGAGLSLSARDLPTPAPLHVKRFQLVSLHWRASGTVGSRRRCLSGRWGRERR